MRAFARQAIRNPKVFIAILNEEYFLQICIDINFTVINLYGRLVISQYTARILVACFANFRATFTFFFREVLAGIERSPWTTAAPKRLGNGYSSANFSPRIVTRHTKNILERQRIADNFFKGLLKPIRLQEEICSSAENR